MARLDATTNKQGALKFLGRLFEDLASATSGGGKNITREKLLSMMAGGEELNKLEVELKEMNRSSAS